MTWLLAIEPSLIAASRTSSGDMLAMTLIAFTLTAWNSAKI